MHIGFVADVHAANHRIHGGGVKVGINTRCRETLDVLRAAIDRAVLTYRCRWVVVSGDLFDSDCPEPQIITEVISIFQKHLEDDTRIIVIAGNHEQSSSDVGDHALGPLRNVATVVDRPMVFQHFDRGTKCDTELLCLPFDARPVSAWLGKTLDEHLASTSQLDKRRVMAAHFGIVDASTPPWLRDARDAAKLEELRQAATTHAIDALFVGNWHDHRLWLGGLPEPDVVPEASRIPTVCQIGALVPTGWDNAGLEGYGSLVVYDTKSWGVLVEALEGPRFVKAKTSRGDGAGADSVRTLIKSCEGFAAHLYVRWFVPAEDVELARSHVFDAAHLRVVEVVPDVDTSSAMARTAAHVTKKAETLDEALGAYLSTASMPDGVDRQDVRLRVLQYLRG